MRTCLTAIAYMVFGSSLQWCPVKMRIFHWNESCLLCSLLPSKQNRQSTLNPGTTVSTKSSLKTVVFTSREAAWSCRGVGPKNKISYFCFFYHCSLFAWWIPLFITILHQFYYFLPISINSINLPLLFINFLPAAKRHGHAELQVERKNKLLLLFWSL